MIWGGFSPYHQAILTQAGCLSIQLNSSIYPDVALDPTD